MDITDITTTVISDITLRFFTNTQLSSGKREKKKKKQLGAVNVCVS